MLFGQHHLNLARIEQKLPVSIVTRGNEVFIQGEGEGEVRTAAAVLEDLYAQLKQRPDRRPRGGRRVLAHGVDGRRPGRRGAATRRWCAPSAS